ncbi:MAG: hypothetical protein A4E56_02896 [Pelotomaculum sp. PtaU1.Bin065]|nr:MAG: hypothetical protein A4E56_02896 [Pelotomaculum sp. PtaU1.Bin065]
MFKNLRAEIARQGLTGKQIATAIGISPRSFSRRMSGKTQFLYKETLQMRNIFFKNLSLNYLFAELI